nr:MAG TPA: hypothetical protein [Caudoviricetes sp.]
MGQLFKLLNLLVYENNILSFFLIYEYEYILSLWKKHMGCNSLIIIF